MSLLQAQVERWCIVSIDPHSLEEALNVEYEPSEKKEKSIEKTEPKAIQVQDRLKQDFLDARQSMKRLIDAGEEGISGIMKVAQEGDHPRAYEVLSQMLKTVSEINKDVLELHKKVSDIENKEKKLVQNNTTNNSFFVGSTSELQDLINPQRSKNKLLENKND